ARRVDEGQRGISPIPANEVCLALHHFPVKLLAPLQSFLRLLALRMVNDRTDITQKLAVGTMPGTTPVQHPSVGPVMPPQAIFHFKWNSFIKGGKINVEAMTEIVRMNAFAPAISHFLFQSPAGKFQPAAIAVRAKFFGVCHPNHNWRGVSHFAKT